MLEDRVLSQQVHDSEALMQVLNADLHEGSKRQQECTGLKLEGSAAWLMADRATKSARITSRTVRIVASSCINDRNDKSLAWALMVTTEQGHPDRRCSTLFQCLHVDITVHIDCSGMNLPPSGCTTSKRHSRPHWATIVM